MSEEKYKPIVGVMCELGAYQANGPREYRKILPKYVGDFYMIFVVGETEKVIDYRSYELRPIKSPREIAIEALCGFMRNKFSSWSDWDLIATSLYDEGYRKKGDNAELISLGVARAIFKVGDELGEECTRIEFKKEHYGIELSSGGLDERALARVIKKYLDEQ